MDVGDLALTALVLWVLQGELDDLLDMLESMLARHIREQRRLNRSLPADKKRITWTAFASSLSDKHFRRMFRMDLSVFNNLCLLIINRVGDHVFRSEAHLDQEVNREPKKLPPICGEVKMAVSIQMMAGGSYLDLVPLFAVSTSHLYNIFEQFLNWILLTLEFPLVCWLREKNWDALIDLADNFAEKTNGVFYGVFCSLDGLAVRIRSPRLSEVPDPGNYYCRKGFYALNVQAICDRKKRFLWCYPSNKGSTHDSAAFAGSRLFDLLLEVWEQLHEHGLFIAGDSAYGLSPFLVTPFDSNQVGNDLHQARDSFNFHLSSCRIYIECAFGELIMRWGIFWRTLLFDLSKSTRIIKAAMLLHNFIVDHREENEETYFRNFAVSMNSTQQELTRQTGEMPRAVVTDNNEPARRGRPTASEDRLAKLGNDVRNQLMIKLATHGLKRPLQADMKYNSYGHIYLES